MLTSSKWASAPDTTASRRTEESFKRKFPEASPLKRVSEKETTVSHVQEPPPQAPAPEPSLPESSSADAQPEYARSPEPGTASYSYDYPEDIAPPAEDDLFDESEEELSSYAPAPVTAHEETHYIAPPTGSFDYPTDPQSLQSQPGADSLFLDDFTPNEEPIVEHPVTSAAPLNAPTGPRNARRAPNGQRHGQAPTDARTQKQVQNGPDGPADPSQPRGAQPVRGDRSATGGTTRVKLTEDELAARMEAAKLRNATLMAAHDKAQADRAAFDQREAEALKLAKQRERVERVNTRQMLSERERNRERKMKSQGTREWETGKEGLQKSWDEEKRGKGSASRRGAHGGVSRGGSASASNESGTKAAGQKEPVAEDFPALPVGSSGGSAPPEVKASGEVKQELKVDTQAAPVKKSWAEQMEGTPTTPATAKK